MDEGKWFEDVQIVEFREQVNDKLRGFMKLRFPRINMEICEFKLLEMSHGLWVAPPTKEYRKRDGSKGFTEIIEFLHREDKRGFQDEVLRAWEMYRPRAPRDQEPSFTSV